MNTTNHTSNSSSSKPAKYRRWSAAEKAAIVPVICVMEPHKQILLMSTG